MAASTTRIEIDGDITGRVEHLATARRRSAHAAWAEYQATGLHLTAEETDDWLVKLEAGEDADPPECHD